MLNFQPLVAAAIYRRYGKPSGTVVYDPCAGWGGRLVGAAAAGNVSHYVACEPSSRTHAGLLALSALVATRRPGLSVSVMRACAEESALPPSSVDVVLTSPPYFCLELYAGEPSQSHLKFPEPSWWLESFLGRLVERSYAALRPGGAMLLNIANNKMLERGGCELEASTCAYAARAGFAHEATLRMLKPRAPGGARGEASGAASEPIFVFRKPGGAGGSYEAAAPSVPAAEGAIGDLLGSW